MPRSFTHYPHSGFDLSDALDHIDVRRFNVAADSIRHRMTSGIEVMNDSYHTYSPATIFPICGQSDLPQPYQGSIGTGKTVPIPAGMTHYELTALLRMTPELTAIPSGAPSYTANTDQYVTFTLQRLSDNYGTVAASQEIAVFIRDFSIHSNLPLPATAVETPSNDVVLGTYTGQLNANMTLSNLVSLGKVNVEFKVTPVGGSSIGTSYDVSAPAASFPITGEEISVLGLLSARLTLYRECI